MSQPVSRYLHPFDVVRHPSLEPEVKRAILASWASDSSAVPDRPSLRHPPGVDAVFDVDDIFAAMRSLDETVPKPENQPRVQQSRAVGTAARSNGAPLVRRRLPALFDIGWRR